MHAHAKKPWHSTTQWRGALAPVSCSRVRRVAASVPDVDAHGALNRCSLIIDRLGQLADAHVANMGCAGPTRGPACWRGVPCG